MKTILVLVNLICYVNSLPVQLSTPAAPSSTKPRTPGAQIPLDAPFEIVTIADSPRAIIPSEAPTIIISEAGKSDRAPSPTQIILPSELDAWHTIDVPSEGAGDAHYDVSYDSSKKCLYLVQLLEPASEHVGQGTWSACYCITRI